MHPWWSIQKGLCQGDIGTFIVGHDDPAAGAAFHYLHHTFFESNYGVPLLDFDRLFGTYEEYVKKPSTNNNEQKN